MYADEVIVNALQGRSYNNDTRRKLAYDYFAKLIPKESILVYYANYSNPFSDEEKQRYIIVGIARLGEAVGKDMFFENISGETAKYYANGLVWQRPLTSLYPEQGMHIPYEQYYDNQEVLENIIVEPDNPRAFKYANSRNI